MTDDRQLISLLFHFSLGTSSALGTSFAFLSPATRDARRGRQDADAPRLRAGTPLPQSLISNNQSLFFSSHSALLSRFLKLETEHLTLP